MSNTCAGLDGMRSRQRGRGIEMEAGSEEKFAAHHSGPSDSEVTCVRIYALMNVVLLGNRWQRLKESLKREIMCLKESLKRETMKIGSHALRTLSDTANHFQTRKLSKVGT